MKEKESSNFLYQLFLYVTAFILGGTGLSILFKSDGNIVSIVGGFALIGIAVAVIKKLIEDG